MSFQPPNQAESNAVAELRIRIEGNRSSEELKVITNTTLLRFFRGAKGDAETAYENLISHIDWRNDENVDDIEDNMDKFRTELNKKKLIIEYYDLNGRPACFCLAHRHNARDRDIQQVRMLTIWSLECLRKRSKPEEERFVIGFYLGRFSLQCMDYEAVKAFITILQGNYPDTLETMLLIDSPMIFSACWMVIKQWIDPVTATKVQFVKSAELSNYFAPEAIPVLNEN